MREIDTLWGVVDLSRNGSATVRFRQQKPDDFDFFPSYTCICLLESRACRDFCNKKTIISFKYIADGKVNLKRKKNLKYKKSRMKKEK